MVKGIEMGLLDKDLDPRYETFVLLCQDVQWGCEGLPDSQSPRTSPRQLAHSLTSGSQPVFRWLFCLYHLTSSCMLPFSASPNVGSDSIPPGSSPLRRTLDSGSTWPPHEAL